MQGVSGPKGSKGHAGPSGFVVRTNCDDETAYDSQFIFEIGFAWSTWSTWSSRN